MDVVFSFLTHGEILNPCRFVSGSWNSFILGLLRTQDRRKSGRWYLNYVEFPDAYRWKGIGPKFKEFLHVMSNTRPFPFVNFKIFLNLGAEDATLEFGNNLGANIEKLVVYFIAGNPNLFPIRGLLGLLKSATHLEHFRFRSYRRVLEVDQLQDLKNFPYFQYLRVLDFNLNPDVVLVVLYKRVVENAPRLGEIRLAVDDGVHMQRIRESLDPVFSSVRNQINLHIRFVCRWLITDNFRFLQYLTTTVPTGLMTHEGKFKSISIDLCLSFCNEVSIRGVSQVLPIILNHCPLMRRVPWLKIRKIDTEGCFLWRKEELGDWIEVSIPFPHLTYFHLLSWHNYKPFSNSQFPALRHVVFFDVDGARTSSPFSNCVITSVEELELYYFPSREWPGTCPTTYPHYRPVESILVDWHRIFPCLNKLIINTPPSTFPHIFSHFENVRHLHIYKEPRHPKCIHYIHAVQELLLYKKLLTGFEDADAIFQKYYAASLSKSEEEVLWENVFSQQNSESSLRSMKGEKMFFFLFFK